MKHIITTLALALVATALSSCACCSGEAPAPPLRPLPQFGDIPQVHYGK